MKRYKVERKLFVIDMKTNENKRTFSGHEEEAAVAFCEKLNAEQPVKTRIVRDKHSIARELSIGRSPDRLISTDDVHDVLWEVAKDLEWALKEYKLAGMSPSEILGQLLKDLGKWR